MRYFLRVVSAEAFKQHRIQFHGVSVYFSMFLWPIIELVAAFYMFKPFTSESAIRETLQKYIGTESLASFLLIGYIGYNFFFSLVQSAWRFSFERQQGTLEMILLTPSSRLAVMLGNAIASLLESVWLLIVFAFGYFIVIGEWNKTNLWLLPIGLLSMVVASVAWGVLLNSFFLLTRDAGLFFNLLQEPLSLIGGVRLPTQLLVTWMQTLSYYVPLTYCLAVMRQIMLSHAKFGEISNNLVYLTILIILMFVISYFLLAFGEKHAKRTGSLTLF